MDRRELSDNMWILMMPHLRVKVGDQGNKQDLNICWLTARLYVPIDTAQAQKICEAEAGFEAHAIGRSKSGLSTKIHVTTDALGNPVRFILTGGQRNDIKQTEGLLNGQKAKHVFANIGYDGQHAMNAIAAKDTKPVVTRHTQPLHATPFMPQSTKNVMRGMWTYFDKVERQCLTQ